MESYKRYSFDTFDNNENIDTLHKSAAEYLRKISDYVPNKEHITLNKYKTILFHASTTNQTLHTLSDKDFKFPLRKPSYFALTRDTAIATLFFRLMNKDEEYIMSSEPHLGFVLEFSISKNIKLKNVEIKSVTDSCTKKMSEQTIGFYTGSGNNTYEYNRDFFNGMIELCLKEDINTLKLEKIHLLNMSRNDIPHIPHILHNEYAIFLDCLTNQKIVTELYTKFRKKVPDHYKDYEDEDYCKNIYGVSTQEEWFNKNKDKINFDNYVIDTKDATIIPKDEKGEYIISDSFINDWYQSLNSKSVGGKSDLIYILGRNRKVIKEGRIKYIRYNNTLIKLTDARKLDKNKKT